MMSIDNHLMIADREELKQLKDKINNYLYELSYSFASLYTTYESMVESGWDDNNQKEFEREMNEMKAIINEDILTFKEISTQFLENKIKIIDEYCEYHIQK